MKHAEIEAMMKAVAAVVRAFVSDTVAPLLKRIDELEQRLAALPEPRDGKDGTSVTIDDVAPLIEETVAKAVAALPPPDRGEPGPPGRDADPEAVRAMVVEEVARIPRPQDGTSITVDDVAPLIEETVAKAVAALPPPDRGEPGPPGRDADPEQIRAMVAEAVAEIPKPKDGAPGKDGVGMASAVIDREGHLVLTMTDGRTANLGRVVGKDGEPGAPGKDGADGLGFEDLEEELADDGRMIIRRYRRGDKVREFRHGVPALIYRGVWREGVVYARGDCVTWGGSLWHCNGDTEAKPGESGEAWTLAVKRGRDGKPGKDGEPGPPGKDGPPGRDLTHLRAG